MNFDLDPAEQQQWDDFVKNFRETTLRDMVGSAVAMMISPGPEEEFNVEYALQLGAAIVLNKPLIVLCARGQHPPPKLAAIADRVVYADVDTEAGRQRVKAALKDLIG